MTYKKILDDVLNEIKPSDDKVKLINNKINDFIKKIKVKDAKIILGGSIAKGTWLNQNYDADIFVQFDYNKYKNEDLSKHLEKILSKFQYIKLHGSRDYFQVHDELTYEIVPTLSIKKAEDALNITDVSPLHSDWVNENSNSKLKDEIRLTKQFFKANNLYGAESHIKGFSGYVLEILTIKFGSFIKLLKASQKFKENEVIDIAKHHKDVFFEVNSSKLISPLIVIDPVQKGRNASAALSKEKYNLFLKISKSFLEKPSSNCFIEKKIDVNKILNNKNSIVLKIDSFEGKGDVIGCKIEKSFKFFTRILNDYDFEIKNSGWEWNDNIIMYFILKNTVLNTKKIVKGPKKEFVKGVEDFKKKYGTVKLENDGYFAEIDRIAFDAKALIKSRLKDKYLKDKMKGVKLL